MTGAVRRGIVAAVSLWLFAIGIGGGIAAQPVITDIGIQPKTFMFVGNSFMYYNNSMHNHFLEIVRAALDPANYTGCSGAMALEQAEAARRAAAQIRIREESK